MKKDPPIPPMFTRIYYWSYTGSKVEKTFNCLDCGFDKCYRPKKQYGHSFFEGFFKCCKCQKEINYYSDDFIRKELLEPVQLTLF
jgi:hypothetical protein